MSDIKVIKCGFVNCFVIVGKTGSILVDTGNSSNVDLIWEQIQSYHIGLVVLTHGHTDHIAGAMALQKQHNLKIAMHEGDLVLARDRVSARLHVRSFRGQLLRFVSLLGARNAKATQFSPDIFLQDGQSLEEYGVDARVLHFPGHTKGSIALLVDGENLIVGDVLMNMGHPSASLMAEDFQMLDESVSRIQSMQLNQIYVGHGKPFAASQLR